MLLFILFPSLSQAEVVAIVEGEKIERSNLLSDDFCRDNLHAFLSQQKEINEAELWCLGRRIRHLIGNKKCKIEGISISEKELDDYVDKKLAPMESMSIYFDKIDLALKEALQDPNRADKIYERGAPNGLPKATWDQYHIQYDTIEKIDEFVSPYSRAGIEKLKSKTKEQTRVDFQINKLECKMWQSCKINEKELKDYFYSKYPNQQHPKTNSEIKNSASGFEEALISQIKALKLSEWWSDLY